MASHQPRERDLPSASGRREALGASGAGTVPGFQEKGNLIMFVPLVRKERLFAGKKEKSSISPGIVLTSVPVSKNVWNPAEKPEGHVPVFADSAAFKPSVTSKHLFLCNLLAAGDPWTFQVPGQHIVLQGQFSRENTGTLRSTHIAQDSGQTGWPIELLWFPLVSFPAVSVPAVQPFLRVF